MRHVIEDASDRTDFCVRTGHSMSRETQEMRLIPPTTAFTSQPGISLSAIAVCTETGIDMDTDGTVEVTGGPGQSAAGPIPGDF